MNNVKYEFRSASELEQEGHLEDAFRTYAVAVMHGLSKREAEQRIFKAVRRGATEREVGLAELAMV